MHYVIGDIHGQIHALKRLLKKLNLKEEDKVYFVGDWFDRAYTEKDRAEMVKWMLEHLRPGTQFCSVQGNHDRGECNRICDYLENYETMKNSVEWQLLSYFEGSEEAQYIRSCYPQIKELIESMPLYKCFNVNGQEYLVTHSWLWDNAGRALGEEGFNIHDLDVDRSIWDREYSIQDMGLKDLPIVIHGHTPTLGEGDISMGECFPLAKIQKVSEKNINVDCCAFYSPLRGGNLAAYCCEDGSEIYAYEDEMFYELVDRFFEENTWEDTWGKYDITKEQWYLAVLFYRKTSVFMSEEKDINFHDERVRQVYKKYREKFAACTYREFIFEMDAYMRRIKSRIHMIVPKYWVMCREDECV